MTLIEPGSATLQARSQASTRQTAFEGIDHGSRVGGPVSVLVSFATVQQGSSWVAMPVGVASRGGLNVGDRPRADLESGLG
jgi:hypothetical protein